MLSQALNMVENHQYGFYPPQAVPTAVRSLQYELQPELEHPAVIQGIGDLAE